MDLKQTKLTKDEWNNIEVPITNDEKNIVLMMCNSYNNLNHSYNPSSSLIMHTKIAPSKAIHEQLFVTYFKEHTSMLIKKYRIPIKCPEAKSCKVKSADKIRIKHTEEGLMQQKDNIFEFIIIQFITTMLKAFKKKSKEWTYYFYTITQIIGYNIIEKNPYAIEFVSDVLDVYSKYVSVFDILSDSKNLIEENGNLLKYADISLYDRRNYLPHANHLTKLVLYIAPTGTGKTLSPLGLSEEIVSYLCARPDM